jgi:hypothetical protein
MWPANTVGNAVVKAYQRFLLLERPRPILSAWAAYVTGTDADNVVPFAKTSKATAGESAIAGDLHSPTLGVGGHLRRQGYRDPWPARAAPVPVALLRKISRLARPGGSSFSTSPTGSKCAQFRRPRPMTRCPNRSTKPFGGLAWT